MENDNTTTLTLSYEQNIDIPLDEYFQLTKNEFNTKVIVFAQD